MAFAAFSQSPWLAAIVLLGCSLIYTLGKIIIVRMALRDAKSQHRANIIKAVAELFRVGNRLRRRGGGAP